MHVYAQNGSSFYGDTPVYQTNGNVKGQTEFAINDGSFDHDNVKLIIAMGGVNDFRGGRSVSVAAQAFVDRINEMTSEFTKAKVVVFLNNQVLISDEMWSFVQGVKTEIKKALGVPVHSMIGWVPVSNYISDLVHVDDIGYMIIAANVIACCYGGNATFIKNEGTYSVMDSSNNSYELKIVESFTDDNYEKSYSFTVPSGVTSPGSISIQVNSSDKKLLCLMSEYSILHNVNFQSIPSLGSNGFGYVSSSLDSRDQYYRGTIGTISIYHDGIEGTYKGRSLEVK